MPQTNSEIYRVVSAWLQERCPPQYRSGSGLRCEVAVAICEHIMDKHDDTWTFATVDEGLREYEFREYERQRQQFARDLEAITYRPFDRAAGAVEIAPDIINASHVDALAREIGDWYERETRAFDCVWLWELGIKADLWDTP